MMAVFFLIAHVKGFKFHALPKLAHILVFNCSSLRAEKDAILYL